MDRWLYDRIKERQIERYGWMDGWQKDRRADRQVGG